jgi:hypothetical protein
LPSGSVPVATSLVSMSIAMTDLLTAPAHTTPRDSSMTIGARDSVG